MAEGGGMRWRLRAQLICLGQEALLREMDFVYGGSIFVMNRVLGMSNCGNTLINYESWYE